MTALIDQPTNPTVAETIRANAARRILKADDAYSKTGPDYEAIAAAIGLSRIVAGADDTPLSAALREVVAWDDADREAGPAADVNWDRWDAAVVGCRKALDERLGVG